MLPGTKDPSGKLHVLSGVPASPDVFMAGMALTPLGQLYMSDTGSLLSLYLDFLTGVLDPRITFTRTGSAATYYDAAGVVKTATANVPRFDHDPDSGVMLGLLIEEQRTNPVLNSGNLALSPWVNRGTGIQAGRPDPSGGNTAIQKSLGRSGTNDIYDSQYDTGGRFPASAALEASVWVKVIGPIPSGVTTMKLEAARGPTGGLYIVDLAALGSDWQRITSRHPAVTVDTPFVASNGANGILFATDFTDTVPVQLWGAQLEAGAFPTSYIPTGSGPITRGKDQWKMASADWYNAVEGTLVLEFIMSSSHNSGADWLSVSASNSNANGMGVYEPVGVGWLQSGGTRYALIDPEIAFTEGQISRIAIAAKANECAVAQTGILGTSGAPLVMPVGVDQLSVGFVTFGGGEPCAHYRQIAYAPTRLTDQELIDMTTVGLFARR